MLLPDGGRTTHTIDHRACDSDPAAKEEDPVESCPKRLRRLVGRKQQLEGRRVRRPHNSRAQADARP